VRQYYLIPSSFLVIWFGLIFISPLFGIHLHHSTHPNQKEVTLIHSYYESDHSTTSQPDESEAQSLFEHISPYGITSDLGDWDAGLVFDISFFFLFPFLIIIIFTNAIIQISTLDLTATTKYFSLKSHIYKKSYLYFCLFCHIPPPIAYN